MADGYWRYGEARQAQSQAMPQMVGKRSRSDYGKKNQTKNNLNFYDLLTFFCLLLYFLLPMWFKLGFWELLLSTLFGRWESRRKLNKRRGKTEIWAIFSSNVWFVLKKKQDPFSWRIPRAMFFFSWVVIKILICFCFRFNDEMDFFEVQFV